MGSFISAGIGYYEGDRISSLDQEVRPRPDDRYVWDGNDWVIDPLKWNAGIDAKIVTLEGGYPLARLDRETKIIDLVQKAGKTLGFTDEQMSIGSAEFLAVKARLVAEGDPIYSPGFARLVDYDNQIAELRRSRI